MKFNASHNHGWTVGVLGVAAGVSMMIVLPRASAVVGSVALVLLFHLVGALVALGSAGSLAPGLVRRLTGRRGAGGASTLDFGWSFGALYGPWIAALALLALAFGLRVQFPTLWPASAVLALFGVSSWVGGVVMRGTRRLDHVPLPIVGLFAGEDDLVLDAGCGSGRTTLTVARVLPKGRIVSLDRFDASYIDQGGRLLLERNVRIAGIADRVEILPGDMTRTPFPDAHFDSAVSAHAIDHLGVQKRAALAEILRVLKPGGRFLVVAWVPGWLTFSLANVFCLLLASPADWRRLAAEVGFVVHDQGMFSGLWFVVLERPV